ncbi:MAG TPA: S41 family peptidase [Gemmataceae bacterium]|nr:S41 family peptidase [Gemmataceae bacterium]
MSQLFSRIAASAMFALAFLISTQAQSAPPQTGVPNTHAVLVGIDQYADSAIKPRLHAEADATAFYDVVTAKEYLGANPNNVHLLLGKKDATRHSDLATRENILAAIDTVVKQASADDLVIFAFFGQGCPVGKEVGILGENAKVADRVKSAISAEELGEKLQHAKAHKFLGMVDVHLTDFENAKEAARDVSTGSFISIIVPKKDEEDAEIPYGHILYLASNGLKSAVELEKHSLFAQTLLDGLQGKADRDGYEPDGLIMADELTKYLKDELPKGARANGKSKEEKEQNALVIEGQRVHYPVSRNPDSIKVNEKRLAQFTDLAKRESLSQSLTEEGLRVLAGMPRLKAQQELRKAYQVLVDGKYTVAEFVKRREAIQEETKLPASDAVGYAKTVLGAIDVISGLYFKELKTGEMAGWAVKELYREAEESLPPELEARVEKAKDLSPSEAAELLTDARQQLGQREDLAAPKDAERSLIRVCLHHLDKHTAYIDVETVGRFRREIQGNYTGIGVTIRRDLARDLVQVISPMKDSPAYKAGVKSGDWIVQITKEVDKDGNPLPKPEVIAGLGLSIDDAVKNILGKAGTKIKIALEREGVDKPVEVEILRSEIVVETILGVRRKADDSWDFMLDPEKKIGYARLTQFTTRTPTELRKAVDALKKEGMKAFILDLRFCPGGDLMSAVNVSDLFIDNGMIVSIRKRNQPEYKFNGHHAGSELDFPMACLINGQSASGAEIVSACLQDYKRAVLVGDRSYGKGSMQNVLPFARTGGILKVTTATFWRPSGVNINKASTKGRDEDEWGVLPDEGFRIKLSRAENDEIFEYMRNQEIIPRRDLPAKESKPAVKDPQLDKALSYLREQAK